MSSTRLGTAFVLGILAGFLVAAPSATAQQNAPRPNIIYILADDLGWKDVGFHGSDIRTPNIDQLARTGAQLDQFYVQPMCTPTRAALMTGRYPLRYGLQILVIPASLTYGLPTDEWLLPQALKEAGYRTAILGKWHLGHAKREFWPMQRVEMFRGALRQGDWKLVWRTTLPSRVELFNLAQDPSEQTNLAEQNPEKVLELEKRIDELAGGMAKSLLLEDVFKGVVKGLTGKPPALPNEEEFYEQADP